MSHYKDYIGVLFYSYYTTITGWGALLRYRFEYLDLPTTLNWNFIVLIWWCLESNRRSLEGLGRRWEALGLGVLALLALRTHILRLLGPKTILYGVFGLF